MTERTQRWDRLSDRFATGESDEPRRTRQWVEIAYGLGDELYRHRVSLTVAITAAALLMAAVAVVRLAPTGSTAATDPATTDAGTVESAPALELLSDGGPTTIRTTPGSGAVLASVAVPTTGPAATSTAPATPTSDGSIPEPDRATATGDDG